MLSLPVHHIGIAVTESECDAIEQRLKRPFKLDSNQGTRVLFEANEQLNCYLEYVVTEGRAKNIQPGYYHTCYSVKRNDLGELASKLASNSIAVPVTKLELSGSSECGFVQFFYSSIFGLFELNIDDIV